MSKKIAQLIHSQYRALERFNVHLTIEDTQQIVWMIQNQLGTHIRYCSSRRSTWIIEYAKKLFYVAYDKNTKMIATVMPISYAICDSISELNRKLYIVNPRKMCFLEKLNHAEKELDLAYSLFKKVTE